MDYFRIGKDTYNVRYLGWKEIRCLWGRGFTEPITKELVALRDRQELPKLTLEVGPKQLRIWQWIEKKKKVEKVKYPSIPSCDITYAIQALSPDEDVVSCIFMGYNPHTKCAAHVHAYKCDSPYTAEMLAHHFTQIVEWPAHMDRALTMEKDLIKKGQVVSRPTSIAGITDDDVSTIASTINDSLSEYTIDSGYSNEGTDVNYIYDSVAAELKTRLDDKTKGGPILFPYKDYPDEVISIMPDYLVPDYADSDEMSKDEIKNKSFYSSDSSKNTNSSKRLSAQSSNSSRSSGRESMHTVKPKWKLDQQSYGSSPALSTHKKTTKLELEMIAMDAYIDASQNTKKMQTNEVKPRTQYQSHYASANTLQQPIYKRSPTSSQNSPNNKTIDKVKHELKKESSSPRGTNPPAYFYDDSVSHIKNLRLYQSSNAIMEHRPLPNKASK